MPIADSTATATAYGLPLSVLLVPFGFFALLYIIYTFFNLYHLVRYGVANVKLHILITFYSLGSFAIIAMVVVVLAQYDWSQTITLQQVIDLLNQPTSPVL